MKKKLVLLSILAVICSTCFKLNAQKTSVVGGIDSPRFMALNGSDLYVALWSGATRKVVKIDLSVTPAVSTDFVTGLHSPTAVAIKGNDLYVTEYQIGKIIKIDLTTKVVTDVFSGVRRPISLAFYGNELYIGQESGDGISKIDVTANPIVKTDVFAEVNFSPGRIVFKGSELYIAEYGGGNTISKIDVTANPIVKTELLSRNFSFGPNGLYFDNNYLYFSRPSAKTISRIDITASSIVEEVVFTTTNDPSLMRGIAAYNNELYISDNAANEIFKIPLPCPDNVALTKTGATLTGPTTQSAAYQWLDCDNNNAVIPNATRISYTATTTGTYALEVRRTGCKDTSLCTVVCIANKPIVTKRRDTLTVPAVTGAMYQWLDCGTNMAVGSATTNLFIPTVSGTYAVELTTKEGCIDTSLCTVVCITNRPTVTRAGVTLTSSTETGATYKWLDCATNMIIGGESTESFSPTVTGDYSVELTSAIGCVDTSICTRVTVCSSSLPIVTKTGTTLTSSTEMGATYRWIDCGNGNKAVLGETTETYTPTVSGNYAVELTKTDGCSDLSLCTVVCVANKPTVTKRRDTLTGTALKGASYRWLDCNGNMEIANETTNSYIPTASGNYALELTTKDGCVDTSICTLVCVASKPIVSKTGTMLTTPVVPTVTYQWLSCRNANKPIAGATTETYTATVTGNYAVELTTAMGCKDTSICTAATVQVTIPKKRLAIESSNASFLAAKGAYIYAPSLPTAGITYKMDIRDQLPVTSEALSSVASSNPVGLAIKDNDLYIAEFAGNKISKIDLATGIKTDVLTTGLGQPYGLAFKGNDLYIGEFAGNKISKIDITVNPIVKNVVFTGLPGSVPSLLFKPGNLVFKGNDLYIVESNKNKVTKMDVTASPVVKTDVIVGLGIPTGLLFDNNDLYISERGANQISKIDITNPSVRTTFVTGLTGPAGMLVHGSYLYVVEAAITQISRFPFTLCTPDEPIVTKTEKNLTTPVVAGGEYRWLDCGTNMAVSGATTNSFTPTVSGSYAVEIARSNGCLDTSVCKVVCIPSKPTLAKAGVDLTTPTVNQATYRWLDCATNTVIGGATSETYTATVTGDYAVELTSAIGCIDTSLCTTVTVCPPDVPVVTKTGTTLTAPTLQVVYKWIDCGNSNKSIRGANMETYTPTVSGNYAVEVTRNNACADVSLCTVVCIANKPTVTKTGATLTTATVPGATYRWLDCGNLNAEIGGETTETYTATVSGSYAVELTSAIGCIDTSLCTVVCFSNKPLLTKTGSTLATATVPRATYQWLSCNNANKPIAGATTATYTATAGGDYAVELVTKEGCKDTSSCNLVGVLVTKPTTTLTTGFNVHHYLAAKDGYIYAANFASTGTVYKMDIRNQLPVDKGTLSSAAVGPVGLAIKDNDLYIGEFTTNKVSKIDLATENRTDVLATGSGLNQPYGIAFKGNDLYIADYGGKISKIDVTANPVVKTDVITGLSGPNGIAFKGNDLYIAEYNANKVSKIDVTASSIVKTDVIVGLNAPAGLFFDNNDLYISERKANQISKVDVTNPSVKTAFITGLSEPVGMMVYGGYLYIVEQTANKISRLPFNPCTPDKPIVTKTGTTLTTPTDAGAVYRWLDCGDNNNPVAGATTATYTATVKGSYAVELIRSNGCVDTSVCKVVCIPSKPSVTKLGATLTVPTVNGATYSWLDCATNTPIQGETSENYTATVTGDYAVELTTQDGCIDTSLCTTVTVCSPSPPMVRKTGTTLTTDIVTGATYKWVDCGNNNMVVSGATTETYTPTVTGNYAVEVTRTNACADVSVCTLVCIANKPIVTKRRDTLTVPAVTGATYKWIDCGTNMAVGSATTNSFIATVSGSYAVELTSAIGCIDTSVCTVVCVANPPIVTKRRDTLKAPTLAGVTYKWVDCDRMNAVITGETSENYIATVSGSYALELTSAIGCIDTSVCTVVCVANPPIVTKRRDTLSTTAVAVWYRWLDCSTNMEIGSATANLFIPTVSGSYAIELTGSNGCKDTSVCTLVCIPSKPLVTKLGASLTAPTLAGAMYRWLDCATNTVIGGATSKTYTATVTGDYAVELTTKEGCVDTSLCTRVTVCPPSVPIIMKTGASLTAPTLAGATYKWVDCGDNNKPIAGATTATYTATVTGNYAVELTRANACADVSVCTLVCIPSKPLVTKTGATLTAPAVNGATYRWIDCGTNMAVGSATTNSFTPTVSGNYALEVTSDIGCIDTSLCAVVCVASKPTVMVAGATLTAPTLAGVTYKWLSCNNANKPIAGATTETYTATASGSYAIELTASNGCIDTSICTSVTVTVTKPTITVATGFDVNHYLAAKDGYIYTANFVGTGIVYKMDIRDQLPINKTMFSSSPVGPVGLAIKDNDLYIGEYTTNKTSKIDLATGTRTDVSTGGLNQPYGIAFKGNDLYIVEYNANKVSKIDVTANPIVRTDVITGLSGPNGIAFKGNDLYIAEYTGGKVSKIDVTANPIVKTDVIIGLNTPAGLLFDNNDLYISERKANQISKIDITNPSVKTAFITGLSEPVGMMVYGSYLYIVEQTASKISRLPFNPCTPDKPIVTKTGTMLTTPVVAGAVYRWLDCGDNNKPVVGATTESFTPTVGGSYAVELIRSGGCVDTSLCKVVCIPSKPLVTKAGVILTAPILSGATYRWLNCATNMIIGGETSKTYTATVTGNYAVELTTKEGCIDTSLCTAVTVCPTNKPIVTKTGTTLTTPVVTGATYKWVDCNNSNKAVPGATANSFTATATGSYAVELTRSNGCADLSVCTTITVGLIENTFATALKLYPNPTSDKVTIELGNNYNDIVVEITNVLGQVITRKSIATITNHKIVVPINASSGIYFISLKAKEGFASFRVVKE